MTAAGDLLKCSFCGKSQQQVGKLMAGPGVYICDECIDLCNQIIEDELGEKRPRTVLDSAIEAAAKEAREAVERLRMLAHQSRKDDPE